MRAGGCTVQQALAPEAAAVVKQAVGLARRRGHAQVTPLHVASAMLSSPAGLLRAACLRSHSHPLQCKALELCFNVALNRLPAATPTPPIFGHGHHISTHYHHQAMSLSNALVAAFKRAQAHQRRGSLETQQQQQQQQQQPPILAVKIELGQLVISILDDPSISRVMREAGFSSTQVKCMVEKALISLDPNPNPSKPKEVTIASKSRVLDHDYQVVIRNEDVVSILDCMAARTKKGVVVVGECLATMEGAVRVVMERISKGEVPAESLLSNLQFIPIQLHSFRHLPREEVDLKLGELRCLVKSFCGGNKGGAVLLVEDLKWAAEFWASCLEKGRGHYCPVEHVIMGIRSLVCGLVEGFWLMGFGTYETYMRCSGGNPSLETLWGLQVLTIPNANLGLSLNYCSSDSLSYAKAKISGKESSQSLLDGGVESQLTCCADCSFKFNSEARSLKNISYTSHSSIASNLPSWLQQYKEENLNSNTDQSCLQVKDLCKKWNSICSSSCRNQHHPSEITLNFSSLSPSSSISSHDHKPWLLPLEAKHPWSEGYLRLSENNDEGLGPDSRSNSQEIIVGQLCNTNPNPNPNSASSSGTLHGECLPKFKELNAENLKFLCDALEKRISWQKGIIPMIVSAVLRCRSGMKRRNGESKSISGAKEETWLFFQGGDTSGKEIVARELAKHVFGSYDNFILVELNTSSSTRSDSSDDHANKRSRLEEIYLDRLFEAIRENPHRVILMEDIEQVDYYSLLGIKKAIESGVIQSYDGDEVRVGDAIIILSCESFDSRSRACSPPIKRKVESEGEKEESEEISSSMCLDLNICIEEDAECLFDNVGLIEAVDQVAFFRLPEEL